MLLLQAQVAAAALYDVGFINGASAIGKPQISRPAAIDGSQSRYICATKLQGSPLASRETRESLYGSWFAPLMMRM
jgi:hypothetical protein